MATDSCLFKEKKNIIYIFLVFQPGGPHPDPPLRAGAGAPPGRRVDRAGRGAGRGHHRDSRGGEQRRPPPQPREP